MPMKIKCADCAGWTGLFNKCKTCKGSKKITVHTTAELKQAQIEAYEGAIQIMRKNSMWLDCLDDMQGKITALKQSMKE